MNMDRGQPGHEGDAGLGRELFGASRERRSRETPWNSKSIF